MAEKLSIQIALEGGKEIERQLEGIGEAGQQAFEQIAKSAEAVGGFKNLKPEEVTQKLKDLGVAGTEAFDKIKKAVADASRMERVVVGIESVENAFGRIAKAAGTFANALKGAAVVEILNKIVQATFKTADAISAVSDQALKLGLTIEKFDQMKLGIEQMGISAKAAAAGIEHFVGQFNKIRGDKVTEAFKELQEAATRGFGAQGTAQLKLIQDAARGTGEQAKIARGYLEQLGLPVPPEAQSTLQRLGVTADNATDAMKEAMIALSLLPDSAQRTTDAFEVLGPAMGPKFIAFLQTGGTGIEQFFAKTNALTQQQAVEAAKLEQAWNRLSSAWERFSGMPFSDVIIVGINLLTAAVEKCSAAMKFLGTFWEQLKKDSVATWEMWGKAMDDWVIKPLETLLEWLGKVGAALQQLLGLGEQVGGGSSGTNPVTAPQGFAGGGPVGGRGSGTSDSNLAWVSRGEHIMPARAVSQPGVLAFLEALRRSGGNLSRVLDGLGRFALGGPVGMPMLPAIAGVGAAHRDLGTVRLVLPDGVMVSGLADAKIVEALGRAAAKAQIRSGGRKPSRYGGN